ncbi:Alpha/Beta hydrolase protein [Pholiota molesta]|nr:Alpha/Beta hydrolase protein [Pholiota molesta]
MYSQLAEIPVPTSAQFIPSQKQTIVQLNFSVKDHVRNIKRTMSKSVVFNSDGHHPISPVSTPLLDIDIVAQIVSSSGKKRATLRNVKLVDGKSNRIVEVWSEGLLLISLNVTDYHGDFYTDEYLGSLSFAPSELAVIYTAEGNAPESKDPYSKFRFNPDFGESLTGKKRPIAFILRWQDPSSEDTSPPKASLVQLKTFEGVRFGQAIFSANSDEIIYATGYEFTADGRFLGIKWCSNRPVGIWRLRIGEASHSGDISNPPTAVDIVKAEKLTPAFLSCRSPRILTSQGKSTLLWLAGRSGGAHVATATLHALDITSDAAADASPVSTVPKTLVDIVDVPDSNLNGFPGLYPTYNLPSQFEIKASESSSSSILVASQWGSRTTVVAISADGGSVKELTPDSDNSLYSWSVLATDGRGRVICSRSAPSVPYEIVLGDFDRSGSVSWTVIDRPVLSKAVDKALSTIRASIISIPGRPFVETIFIQGEMKGNGGTKPPCITSPHGGPHGTTSTAFSPNTVAFVLEGYTLSLPNYTGSPGYGERFLQALIGRCGELDVQDCIATAKHIIGLGLSAPGPGKQFISGGSHGGFLAAHLIGQYPDFFSAAALRNPVISASDVSNTDIPDWYFAEFGLGYPLASSPASSYEGDARTVLPPQTSSEIPPLVDGDAFAKLQAASPTRYLDDMKVPVLLMIGAADRRVAPAQGILFYHALKARYSQAAKAAQGAKVDMLVFEGESHPLDGVEASRVLFEATRDWFKAARSASSC